MGVISQDKILIMTVTDIGKYRIYKDTDSLKIKYKYTFSDFIGSIWFVFAIIIGVLLLSSSLYRFDSDDISKWVILFIGAALLIFGLLMIMMGLFNPRNGILQIQHDINKVIIRDFFKTNKIDLEDITGFFYEIKTVRKPKQLYAEIFLKKYDNEKIICFIVRSNSFIDLKRNVEKELYKISVAICKVLSAELNN